MRNEAYQQIYNRNAFTNWDYFEEARGVLEGKIIAALDGEPELKLVGSAATRTMRNGAEDFDYAVAFQNSYDNQKIIENIAGTNLDISEINFHKKFGYVRIVGKFNSFDFVMVPLVHPNGEVTEYEQDPFYHSDLINKRKKDDHSFNVILAKEFFSQVGIYKKIKGISAELMILKYGNFDNMLSEFTENDKLRINFSPKNNNYSQAPLIVDYPFLGDRSFTRKITTEDYGRIQECAIQVLKNPKNLVGRLLH